MAHGIPRDPERDMVNTLVRPCRLLSTWLGTPSVSNRHIPRLLASQCRETPTLESQETQVSCSIRLLQSVVCPQCQAIRPGSIPCLPWALLDMGPDPWDRRLRNVHPTTPSRSMKVYDLGWSLQRPPSGTLGGQLFFDLTSKGMPRCERVAMLDISLDRGVGQTDVFTGCQNIV